MSPLTCATVAPVTEEAEEEKYHWIVMFNQRGKVYPYLYRTLPHMTAVVKKFHDEHSRYPFLMWVIVEGEMQKVEFASSPKVEDA